MKIENIATTTVNGRVRRYTLPGIVAIFLSLGSVRAKEITVPSGQILTIQQGVDAAAPGDTVIVMPGTYTNPALGQWWPPVIAIGPDKRGLKLRAAGPSGSVKIVGPSLGWGIGIEVVADNVRIEGFDISGFLRGIHAGGLQTQGSEITRNTIHDCSEECIMLTGSSNYELDHNVLGGGQYGIFLNGWPGAGPNILHHLHHNLVNGSQNVGIFLWNSPQCLIENNECDNSRQIGIYVANSPNGTVVHNQAGQNGSTGIAVGGSPDCVVAENETNNNGDYGISVGASCGTLFKQNSAEGNGQYDLFAPNWDSFATCNTYKDNSAATAVPSLSLWDVTKLAK